MIIGLTIYWLPLVLFAIVVTINFKNNLTLAFCLGTVIAKSYILFIHPRIALTLFKNQAEFPEEQAELKS